MLGFTSVGETVLGAFTTGIVSRTLNGVGATAELGSISTIAGVYVYPTGVGATASLGTISAAQTASPTLTSVLGDIQTGSVVADGNADAGTLTGVQGTGQVGSLAEEVDESIGSVSATASVSDPTIIAASTVIPTGVESTGSFRLADDPVKVTANVSIASVLGTSSLGTITATGVTFVFDITTRSFKRTMYIPREQGLKQVVVR